MFKFQSQVSSDLLLMLALLRTYMNIYFALRYSISVIVLDGSPGAVRYFTVLMTYLEDFNNFLFDKEV